MAIINANRTPPVTINTQDTYNFGDAAGEGSVNTTVLSLVSTSFSGSITVVGRPAGTSVAFTAIPYVSRYLNGSVAADAAVTTAITGSSTIEINSTGLDVGLDCTSFSSGSMAVYPSRVQG